MTTKAQQAEREEFREKLREILKPGDTVYTNLHQVSQSGMSRHISLHIVENNKYYGQQIRDITGWAARAMGERLHDKYHSIRVGGCGMDMGFHLVYNLGRYLFKSGFGEQGELPMGHKIRPKTKEMAAKAVTKGAKFFGRNGDPSGWDNDGGYALEHKWM